MCGLNLNPTPVPTVNDLAMLINGVVQLVQWLEPQPPTEEDIAIEVLTALKYGKINRDKAIQVLKVLLEKEMRSANVSKNNVVNLPSLPSTPKKSSETRIMDLLEQLGI